MKERILKNKKLILYISIILIVLLIICSIFIIKKHNETSSDFELFSESDKGKPGKNKKFEEYRNAPII